MASISDKSWFHIFFQELSYLSSILFRKKNKSEEEVMKLLNEAIDIHFGSLKVHLKPTELVRNFRWHHK